MCRWGTGPRKWPRPLKGQLRGLALLMGQLSLGKASQPSLRLASVPFTPISISQLVPRQARLGAQQCSETYSADDGELSEEEPPEPEPVKLFPSDHFPTRDKNSSRPSTHLFSLDKEGMQFLKSSLVDALVDALGSFSVLPSDSEGFPKDPTDKKIEFSAQEP